MSTFLLHQQNWPKKQASHLCEGLLRYYSFPKPVSPLFQRTNSFEAMTLFYTLMHNSYFTCRLHITLATPLLLCTGDVNLERKKLCEYQTVLHNVHWKKKNACVIHVADVCIIIVVAHSGWSFFPQKRTNVAELMWRLFWWDWSPVELSLLSSACWSGTSVRPSGRAAWAVQSEWGGSLLIMRVLTSFITLLAKKNRCSHLQQGSKYSVWLHKKKATLSD